MNHVAARRLFWLSFFLFATALFVTAESKQPHFTAVFSKQEFARRRAKVMDTIGSKAVAVIRGNEGMPGYVEFRQNNTFFYLSGVEAPSAVLLLDGGTRKATLFLPPASEWEWLEGPVLVPDKTAQELTGIDNVREIRTFTASLGHLATLRETLYTPMEPQELEAMSRDLATRYNLERISDPWDGRASREAHLAALLRERLPSLEIKDLSPILDRMRLIKSEEEIAVIRRSTEIAALSLKEAMRSTRPGQYEYELDALAQFIFFRNGAQGLAYYALVASGRNAYMPHYHAGRRKMRDGDFLLMDFAPDYHYYMADVTRMWPVNGQFSPEQRELYGFYLKCYQAIIKNIRPNVAPRAVRAEATAEMEKVLRESTFSKDKYRRAAEKFVADYRGRTERPGPGRLGHWVGMSTHDVGGGVDVLKPGMVFTIEPALRVPEDEIYIRLEDMILITEAGAENLSAMVPMEIDAIEALMKETGILEQHPRILAHDAVRPKQISPAQR